ncbi:uncharacterized protein LOC132720615 [Ruditapes philippinarum]|uniref:uncharacterized protein LOC132720615 n=1 Tax=Ruditapes philippinarum TaxID=129788 RepID=UPI00295AB908|nr:uncharacterized protein LOC132720615 [Ruditapes philippinarum]
MIMRDILKIVMFLCILKQSYSDNIFDEAFEQDLERFVEKTMECRHIPGLTLSVVKDSKIWAKGYGTADFSNGRMVDNTTLFGIGSVTKSFTMVLLGILLTEKGLDWDTKVHDILGSDYEFIDEYRSKETTLRDLLSHRTGLARLDIGLFSGFPKSLSRAQLSMKMKYLPQLLPFRDRFLYNNFMFMYLGHIAEKLGEDTWENLLKSKVLLPIGMTSTQVLKQPEDVLKDNVAKPYIFNDNEFQNGTLDIYSIYPAEPAGAILSTGEDMAKYLRFHLKDGTTEDGKTLLNPILLFEAYTATTPTVDKSFLDSYYLTRPEFPISETPQGYGHAWFSATYRGYRKIWHSGGLFSYITQAWFFPDINAGVFASVNGPALAGLPGYALRTIMYYITDKLIGEDPWLNETTTCEFPDLWRNITTNSTAPEPFGKLENPSEYTGIYGSYFLPALTISTKPGDDSSLLIQMNRLGGVLHSTQDKDRFLMEITSPWEYMTAFIDGNNNTVFVNSTFIRNKDGEVRSIEFKYEVKTVYTKDITIFDDQVSGQAAVLKLDTYCIIKKFIVLIAFSFVVAKINQH